MRITILLFLLSFLIGCNDTTSNTTKLPKPPIANPNIIDPAKANFSHTKNDRDAGRITSIKNAFPGDKKKHAYSLTAKFGSFLGGAYFERAQSVYVDKLGYIYIAGHTSSEDFPVTANSYNTIKTPPSGEGYDTTDGFVAKITPDGTKIVWATLIGGSRRDQVYAVRTDSKGNVYLVGATGSQDFPTTPGAYDTTFNGPIVTHGLTDIFVASLSPDGKKLLFSTFIGGSQGREENPRGAVQLDEKRGRIYVSGQTSAPDFPTTKNAYQPKYGGGTEDAFVFALSIDGSKLLASTFIGGSGSDSAFTGIKQHPSGDSYYIAGATNSKNFPITPGAFQNKLASGNPKQHWWEDGDAFVARISADLDKLIFSTYYGGSNFDEVSHNQGVAVDSKGRVVVIGNTKSFDLPVTRGSFSTTWKGSWDGFVAIFSDTGKLEHATYFGGSDLEEVSGAYIGPEGRIFLTGGTHSSDFIVTPNAYQPKFGNGKSQGGKSDGFLIVFDPSLTHLEYSTFLGGNGDKKGAERGRSVWVTPAGRVVVAGVTDSANFPILPPSVQKKYGGGYSDAFYIVFDPNK